MFCKNCGIQIKEDAIFCPNCGVEVGRRPKGPAIGQETKILDNQSIEANKDIAPAVQDMTQVFPKAKKKERRLNTALVVILCTIFVLFGTVATIGISIRSLTSEEKINALVDEMDLSEIEINFPEEDIEGESITNIIYSNIPENIKEYFSKKDIKKLVNKSYFKTFIADKLNDYIGDVFDNTGDGVIKTRELTRFINKNIEKIYNQLDIPQKYQYDVNYDAVADFVSEGAEDIGLEEISSLDTYREEFPIVFSLIEVLFSYIFIIVLFAVCALIAIFIICSNKFSRAGKSLGISIFILSIINFAVLIAVKICVEPLTEDFILGKAILEPIFSIFNAQFALTGAITLITAVIIFAVAVLVSKIRKSSR